MIEYTEQAVMVDALRYCITRKPCDRCPGRAEPLHCRNSLWIAGLAADMIERLYANTQEQQRIINEQDEEIAELKNEIMRYPSEEAGT